MRLRTIPTLAGFVVLMALTGCGHTPAQESAPPLAYRAADHALAMVGKPYRYGGNSPKGFDCSGLVQYSYARVGVKLPQGTRNLLQVSQPVSRNRLQRGDLVFFTQEGKRSSHVALYLGDGRFVHAPSSGKRVHVAGFHDNYWQRHFTEARRIEID
ncbi:MAG TPA: C40 family peptidase [Sulfuricaulis sp.]|nr:C40 family peptidase [Sulfuricaulis sp.]